LQALCARLNTQGGALLVIDYGYAGPALGVTFQALRAHAYVNPFEKVGAQDVTAHVDFGTLAAAAVGAGCDVARLTSQGQWLIAHGIEARAEALRRAHPERAAEIAGQYARLTHSAQMGDLFKVLEVTAPGSA
ncbi:MAG: SAM-dependent methyltransferase, partial [Alphaproteobacteria bacterium]|nr:SAM-dependent methyltransferase [Alphaproteobacteria bacterium]